MREDIKTNYDVIFDFPIASVEGRDSENDGVILDMHDYRSAAFIVALITSTATATVDAKLQHSPDGSTWTDEDGATGNGTSITQLVVGDAASQVQLDIVRAQDRYYQIVTTVGTDTVTGLVTQVAGPKVRVNAEA